MAKRRGNQERSIYKRKGGLWCVQVSLDNHRLTKYFKTRREAREWLTEILEQIQAGQSIDSGRISLADFLGKWLNSSRSSLRTKTWVQYHQICRDHILPDLGEVRLRDLRPDQIQGLYNSKIECNVSTNTVRIMHAVLHRSLEQAVRWGMVDRNPAKAVIRPKPCRKEIQTLNSHQARQFLIAARDPGMKHCTIWRSRPDCAPGNCWVSNGTTWTGQRATSMSSDRSKGFQGAD